MKHSYSRFSVIILLVIMEMMPAFSSSAQTRVTMALGYRRSINTDWMGYNSASVIRDSMRLTEPHLMANYPLLRSKILRYPGGGIANWWDWKKGWFVDSPQLPVTYQNLPVKNNGLDSLKKVIDASGATPIFVLNMISSTLQSQLRMLDSATAKGLPVKYVELGNEFYLDEESDSTIIYSKFPTGDVYGSIASNWCDSIHKYYPDVKVAAIAAFNRNHATQRVQWDTAMYRTLSGQNSISFHSYFSAAAASDSVVEDTFTMADVPTMLYRPFKMWDIMASQDLNLVPPGNDVWITEYNLQDHYLPVHGSWAHGLFIATQTLQYLNDSRITHLAAHAICGTAVYGMYFSTRGGFHFGGYDGTFVPEPSMLNDTTQFWGLTAAGRTMKTLGIAIENMTYVSPLHFIDAPLLTSVDDGDTATYPSIYGWLFTNDTATHAIIVNLSGTKYTLKTKYAFPNGGSLVEYYADPTLYVDSESNITVKNKSTMPLTFNADPYSIIYMRGTGVPPLPPAVNVTVNGSTIFCEGDSVQLDAGPGFVDYLWSTGETTQTIWAKSDGNYTVAVRSLEFSYQALDSIKISVLEAPAKPKIISPFSNGICEGTTAELEVKLPDAQLTYTWSNGTTGLKTTIFSGGYYSVTATDASGCKSSSDPDTLISFPMPVPVVSPIGPLEACYDIGVVLEADSGYKIYTWSDGTFGEIQTFKTTGSYTVTVKDNNNCYGTSDPVTVTIHTPKEPTITIEGATTFCSGTSPTNLKTISGYSYQWLKGGNEIAGATSKKYYPTESGTYKVIITDAWSCTKKSTGVTITTLNAPGTNLTIDGPKNVCEGVETTLLKSKECVDCTFQWKKNDVIINGATAPTLTVTYAGDYTYVATNSSGCSAVSNKKTITSKTCRLSNGLSEEENLISIYPNPASNSVHLFAANLGKVSTALLVIRNVLGEVVKEEMIALTDGNISVDLDTGSFLSGVYLLTLQTSGHITSRQLVIERE